MSCVMDMEHAGKRDSVRMLYRVKGDGRRLLSSLSESIKDMRNTVINDRGCTRKGSPSVFI